MKNEVFVIENNFMQVKQFVGWNIYVQNVFELLVFLELLSLTEVAGQNLFYVAAS